MLNKEISKAFSKEKLDELSIGVIYHFGSTAAGLESFSSDIDLGVVLKDESLLKNSLETYSKIYYCLTDYIKLPSELDIVLLQQTSVSFQYQVINGGIIIYETSPEFRSDYEEYAMKMYLDFKPLEIVYSQVIREAFK